MRVLIVIIVGFFIVSCQPSKPLTPQDAFNTLKAAYSSNDMQKVTELLSTNSKTRIQSVITNIQSMNPAQIATIAKYYEVPVEYLQTMNIPQYLLLQRKIAALRGDDVLLTALNQPISQVTIAHANATILLYNGMSLLFVKEGPYWYFEYE